MVVGRSESRAFKPRARLLRLLGDELIRDPNIAIFELVKNAYDADASHADVWMAHIAERRFAFIMVEDDGSGMDWETLTGAWMEPGTDFRKQQRGDEIIRTAKFGRLPLGEKGVGRFAAGKLGDKVQLITRAQSQSEIVVNIDWNELQSHDYLSDAMVPIRTREPVVFTGGRTGTQIFISALRNEWNRGMVRNTHRAITSMCSPFGEPGDFQAELHVLPETDWLSGLVDPKAVIEEALFTATGKMWGGEGSGGVFGLRLPVHSSTSHGSGFGPKVFRAGL